jgi:hypothetical protein
MRQRKPNVNLLPEFDPELELAEHRAWQDFSAFWQAFAAPVCFAPHCFVQTLFVGPGRQYFMHCSYSASAF